MSTLAKGPGSVTELQGVTQSKSSLTVPDVTPRPKEITQEELQLV